LDGCAGGHIENKLELVLVQSKLDECAAYLCSCASDNDWITEGYVCGVDCGGALFSLAALDSASGHENQNAVVLLS